MATLSVVGAASNSSTGIGFAFVTMTASSSNGDAFLNTGREVVLFTNSSSQGGASVTVTVAAQAVDIYGAPSSTHNITITVPTSSGGFTAIGPFRPALFNDSNGLVQMTYSAAGLGVKVISIAPQS